MADNDEKTAKQQMAEALNLLDFTASQQNKISGELLENISVRINIAILDRLTAEDKKELQKTAKTGDKEAVLAYLNSKISGLSALAEKITRETIEEFEKLRA